MKSILQNTLLLLCSTLCIFSTHSLPAQAPLSLEYPLVMPGTKGLHQLPNGEMYMVGQANSAATVFSNLLVAKLSATGAVLWAKEAAIPNTLVTYASASAPTPDGGIAVSTYDVDFNENLYKLDAQGNLVWAYAWVGGSNAGNPVGMVVLQDGAVVLAVRGEGGAKARLIKVNANGALGWQRDYYFGIAATFEGLCLTSDGQIAATGILELSGPLSSFVIKMDSAGTEIWSRRVDGIRVSGCVANDHGGLCIIGESLPDMVIANVDSGGAVLRSFPAANGSTDYLLAPWQADSMLVYHDDFPNGYEVIRSDFNGIFNPVSTYLSLGSTYYGPWITQMGAQGIVAFTGHFDANLEEYATLQEFQIGASTGCVLPGQAPGTNALTTFTSTVYDTVADVQGFQVSLPQSAFALAAVNYLCTSSSSPDAAESLQMHSILSADGMLHVELQGPFYIEVHDLNGRLLAAADGNGSVHVSTASWPSGVYLLSARAEGTTQFKKLALLR